MKKVEREVGTGGEWHASKGESVMFGEIEVVLTDKGLEVRAQPPCPRIIVEPRAANVVLINSKPLG